MTTNDGGPAFPSDVVYKDAEHAPGMSLRDYFAGQALTAFAYRSPDRNRMRIDRAEVAGICYLMADAMLAERYKEDPDADA